MTVNCEDNNDIDVVASSVDIYVVYSQREGIFTFLDWTPLTQNMDYHKLMRLVL